MNIDYILTTSGFILPNNPYYVDLNESQVENTSIFDKTTFISADNDLANYIKNNRIHTSPTANKAYATYIANPTFENYIELIDIATNVLSKINHTTFFEVQASNKNMSPMSFMFCLDVLSRNFADKHLQYNAIPLNARLAVVEHITNEQIRINNEKLRKCDTVLNKTWETFLSRLASKKPEFLTFFRYVFVDAY